MQKSLRLPHTNFGHSLAINKQYQLQVFTKIWYCIS